MATIAACWLILLTPVASAQQIVGDANRDGQFDRHDVSFAMDALRHGVERANPLADVAEPCDGVLRAADGRRLLAALLTGDTIEVKSRCHSAAIGHEILPPPPRQPMASLEDVFKVIAEKVPSFAGFYIEQGELRIALADSQPAGFQRAKNQIERIFGTDRFELDFAQPVLVDYRLLDLLDWRDAAEQLLLQQLVTFLDADERRNRLRIGLHHATDLSSVESALGALGIPLQAVELFEQPVMKTNNILTAALNQEQRPLIGGLMVQAASSGCTLGFTAERDGVRGYITNSHCLAPMGKVTFVESFQPTVASGLVAGFELVDPVFGCGGTCLAADAAFVAMSEGVTGHFGWIAGSPGASPSSSYFGRYEVAAKGLGVCGETVHRVDPILGETTGEITATCATALAATGGIAGAPPLTTLTCQDLYDAPGPGGTSGGPVFRVLGSSADVELLGMHWGSAEGVSVFSPMDRIELRLGPLDVVERNDVPEIEITAPPDGTNLGSGSFPIADLEATVSDFESGANCSACTVAWVSSKDGVLGTSFWIDGSSSLSEVLSAGPGYRAITATAKDDEGAVAWDTIVLSTHNSPPQVWIDWPGNGSLYRNVPFTLQGSSFDAELFHALPCADLTWTVTGPSSASFPTTGCTPTVVFETSGPHTLTLTGKDSGGLEASDSVTLDIWEPTINEGPVVTFLSPAPGSGSAPEAPVTITAQVTDPNGPGTIAIEWTMYSPSLVGPSVSKHFYSATVSSGDFTSLTFQPLDELLPGCGGVAYEVTIWAIDDGGQGGYGTLPLSIVWPPC